MADSLECELCGASFDDQSELQEHVREEHEQAE